MDLSKFKLNQFKKSFIALSVSSVLPLVPSAAIAADESADEIERVQITGSRIQRTDLESALPVTVISSVDIAKTGLNDIAGVLRQSVFNSAGSNINTGNSTDANHSGSGLRGLGANRTLTLINGRQVAPSSALYGSSTNLNMIPIEAVERIEILRDGASAIYGSNAIAGVVNIILKKDYDGLGFKLHGADTSRGGGSENGFSMSFGQVTDKSSVTLIYEHQYQEGLKGGERDHIDGKVNPRRMSTTTPWGNWRTHEADGEFGPWNPGKECPQENIRDEGEDGKRCTFDFYEGKLYYPERKKDSIFTHFTYNISEELEWYAQSLILRDVTDTAASSIWMTADMAADNPNNPTFGTGNAKDVQVTHRMVGDADRAVQFDTTLIDFNTGFEWVTDAGALAINIGLSREKFHQVTKHYAFKDRFQDAVHDGEYNPLVPGGNATRQTLDNIRHTAYRSGETTSNGISISWAGLSGMELAGGEIGYAIGAEYRKTELADEMDAQSNAGLENGNVVSSFGGDVIGERDYKAAYVEVELPVLDELVVKVASRYDEYSLPDAGELSSSINVRYEASDDLVLRGGFSQGFRVAGLNRLVGDAATGYYNLTDCPDSTCDTQNIPATAIGTPNLKPETSEQFSVGAVWNLAQYTAVTVDYWNIEITDQISRIEPQDVIDLSHANALDGYNPEQIYVNRDADGKLTSVGYGYINMVGAETSGIDIAFNTRFDFEDMGEIRYTLDGSYTFNYDSRANPNQPEYDRVGYVSRAQYRVNSQVTYILDEFSANIAVRYLDRFKGVTNEDEVAGREYDDYASATEVDLGFNYQTDSYGSFTIGARNIFDRVPEVRLERFVGFNTTNHNIYGRTLFADYTIQF
ncbi:TonB-dependent receptor plug domain-containing protein [Pseudoalteromonas luteoviolacea]|uniref:Putative Fe transport outer membrane receptor protein n=1 Tax=Pseudoalteromonas luteoviolacea (strain 2ta16) TaxID=1353533 RepID=V4HAG5_PSEL2|nr:TonB-dependent receptor [Pseudoalteromonas luteoviolacea]ESP94451.1 putative Fe transport outer membrane receptor protein [Pseudoalteromonas luteoviolacea 2ta16]KZN32145.1 hypothetical protein N483_03100 [Pseudoalteromonas luteoviolacea NCIMB 1944]